MAAMSRAEQIGYIADGLRNIETILTLRGVTGKLRLERNLQLSAASFTWALQGICQLNRIAFSPELVLQQVAPPYSTLELGRTAETLGLKSVLKDAAASGLGSLPRPFLAICKPGKPVGGEVAGDTPEYCRIALVLKVDLQRVLLIEEGGGSPLTRTLREFEQDYAGQVMLFSPAADHAAESDPALARKQSFGFRWFIPEILRHKAIWRDVLLASLAIQLMALATPIFTQVVIDKVIVHHTFSTLVVIGCAMLVFLLFTAAMTWVRQYLVLHTGNRIDAVLGSQVFEHLFMLPPRYFDERPTGTLVARVHGVETIREFLSGAAVTLLLDVPFLFIFLAVMFYYSVPLTLITLVVLSAIVILSVLITPLLRRRLDRQFLLGARNQAFLTEYISGMDTVKSLQMEPQLSSRFGDYLATYLAASFSTRQLSNSYNVAAHALEQLLTLSILFVGAWMVMTNQGLTIGMLVAFQMFASRLSGPMLRLAGIWQEFQQASIAVKRLGDVMNAPTEPYALAPAREMAGRGRIEIRNLAFRYSEKLPYLYRNLSLTLEPGRCVAIMGPSGCGKSTLARLLLGYYQPDDGAILIDGRDIRNLSANELRLHFGVVPQDTFLFSGSIYDNLVIAHPHAGFADVILACKHAGIHEAIESLPEGYRTRIGEHGAGLSGGQKQRIAIARALLKRPRVLIFDEATSNLDGETAEHFAHTVNSLKSHVTLLFIAHHLPRSLAVDEVIDLAQITREEK